MVSRRKFHTRFETIIFVVFLILVFEKDVNSVRKIEMESSKLLNCVCVLTMTRLINLKCERFCFPFKIRGALTKKVDV